MVKIMENHIKMDDLGGKPTIFGNIQILTDLIVCSIIFFAIESQLPFATRINHDN